MMTTMNFIRFMKSHNKHLALKYLLDSHRQLKNRGLPISIYKNRKIVLSFSPITLSVTVQLYRLIEKYRNRLLVPDQLKALKTSG